MKSKLSLMGVFLVLLTMSACAGGRSMNEMEVWTIPENMSTGLVRVLSESETLQREAFDYALIPVSEVLLLAEAQYGLAHPLCFQADVLIDELADSDSEKKSAKKDDSEILEEECVSVIKVEKDDQLYLLFYDKAGETDFSRKAIIGSRIDKGLSQQYTLDGKSYDNYSEKFSWQKVSAMEDYPMVEILKNVQPDSREDKELAKIFSKTLENSKDAPSFSMVVEVLRATGKLTQNDVILLGATNFYSLYMVVGVRLFAVVDVLMRNPDPSQPYYGTGNATRYDVAKMLAPTYSIMKKMRKEVMDALKAHDKRVLRWEALMQKAERAYNELESQKAKK